MASISHLCMLSIGEMHNARNHSHHTQPSVTLRLFIAISICGFLCPNVYFLAEADNNTAPSQIHIGALVSYDTLIGRVARIAIQMAVDDVNKDKNMFNISELVLQMLDTNCSAFPGVAAATELFKQEVIAVIGPQSTDVSHFVVQMATATQVPLLSFAVTDPVFSESHYPYFFRIAHSDAMQMQAISSLIGMYKWREVLVIYIDDACGRSGAAALSDALQSQGVRVVQMLSLRPDYNKTTIGNILSDLSAMKTTVFVVHMPQNQSLLLFSEAKDQGMMSDGYVWIISDLTIGTLSLDTLDAGMLSTIQGIIGIRGYYATESPQLQAFVSEWNNQSSLEKSAEEMLIYALYAYDATRMLALAIDSYMKDGYNITFKNSTLLSLGEDRSSDLSQLKVFEGGPLLINYIAYTQFNGTSGYIQLNANGDLIRSAFEIVNVVDGKYNKVGYWTNETQLSVNPPGNLSNADVVSEESLNSGATGLKILWPGNLSNPPRGWLLPKSDHPLQIAVPRKVGFKQFLSWNPADSSNSSTFTGYCIDVFNEALKNLPYTVPYDFKLFGNETGLVYNDMIYALAAKKYDAVVGDVTITAKRMEIVDFTVSFKESGLVVVIAVQSSHSSYPWAFLRPFSPAMWCTTLAFFIFTGIVIWLLEHKKNRDFQGHPTKQVVISLWFTFSTLFFSQRERTKSTFGRFVVLVWLFVVLIITSSYTANLTSILTVHQLTPTIQGISSLQASNDPIGYQSGSFVRDYLISMNIAADRLRGMNSIDDYAEALTLGPSKGGVAAVVEELPYVEVFLSTKCGFTIVGDPFTNGGWGFAFPKDSQLAMDISSAIMNISENGNLRRIQDYWLTTGNCASSSNSISAIQLSLGSFWGLFLVTGTASVLSLVIYMIRLLFQFMKQQRDAPKPTMPTSTNKGFMRSFASYVNKSAIRTDKRRGSGGDGGKKNNTNKQKKKVVYLPSQITLSDQRFRSYQGSPLSRSSSSISSSSSQGCPFCQSSRSCPSSSPAHEIPSLAEHIEPDSQGSA